MRRDSYRDRAVVIRTYDFGEADRIVVLLTRSHGIVRSVAKGVRRSKSRFGSRLQYFVDLDVQLYMGKNLATITEADTVAYYGSGIIDDYDRYTAACVAMETAERLAVADGSGDNFLFDATAELFSRMQETSYPTMVLDAFCLSAMAHAGWAPSLFDCAQCGAPGPHHAFHPAVGGAACLQCRPPGASEVEEEVLHLMWLLAHDHWAAAVQIVANQNNRDLATSAHRLTSAHLQWHLESRITSLKIMDQR